jgi:hypothetical protein
MPMRTVKLQPGVNVVETPTLNQTQLAASNLIRFYGGLVTKLGGWSHMNDMPLIGTCRGMEGWADIAGNAYIACGTEQRLQVLSGGTIEDITPIFETTNGPPSFFTTAGSPLVTVFDSTYNPNPGDWINITTQVSVGGIILFGYYQVLSSDGSSYVIDAEPASQTIASLINDGGVLVLAGGVTMPPTSGGVAGSVWSNGGVVSVVPGVTPDPSAPPVFFGAITAAQLILLGGGNLPITQPTLGSGQLWNSGGEVQVA